MEMTIEESLEWLISRKEHYEMDDSCQELAQSLGCAIDIMCKYQKIQNIVRDYYNEQYTDKLDIEIIEMISEVLEGDRRWED